MRAGTKLGTEPQRVGPRSEEPEPENARTIQRTSLLAAASVAEWSLFEMKSSARRQLRFFGSRYANRRPSASRSA